MASEELKPCPFCGGDVSFHKDEECDGCHFIQCGQCRAFFDFATGADPENESESVEELRARIAPAWNRRAQDFDAMRQRAEKAEQALHEIRHANMNGPVSENNAGCIKRIEQIAERALAGVKEAKHDQVCS